MAGISNSFDYLNYNLRCLENDIERYISYLESEGKTPGGLERTRMDLRIFFTYAPSPKPSEEQFLDVMKGLEEHGYVTKLRKEILATAGKFYKYRDKTNPYDAIRPKHNTRWYEVPETEIPFMDQVESFLKFVDGEPMNQRVKDKHRDHIMKALRILRYERRVSGAEDIDLGCFDVLSGYLDNSSYVVRRNVMYTVGLFVRHITENDVYREYQNLKGLKNDFERTPQWAAVMDGLDRYINDAKERGFTEVSVSSLRTNETTAFRRLFSICGPLYPQDINEHHLRQFRNESSDLKDKTIRRLLGYMGRMLRFLTGKDPSKRMDVYWSKQDEERTWIFKEEWKLMYGSATTAERLVLLLGAGMGLRRNEMATLKLSDICGSVMTIRGKGHGRGKIVEKEIPHSVLCAIEDYLPERDALIRRFGDRYDGSLIVPPFYSNGKTTLNRYVGELVRTAANRVGVEATCHTLRRFYCTNLLDGGFELDVVRRMMRHSCLDTTLIYVNTDPRKLKAATASVDSALF